MNRLIKSAVNGLTWYRLLAVPILVTLLIAGRMEVFKWMLALSFITDAVDGILARKYKVTTRRGARLDSLADDLTVTVAIVGLVAKDWLFLAARAQLVAGLLLLYFSELLFGLVRYGKITSFHTWLAKAAAVIQAVFLCTFFFYDAVKWLFDLAVALTALELIEELVMIALLRKYLVNVPGLIWALRLRRAR